MTITTGAGTGPGGGAGTGPTPTGPPPKYDDIATDLAIIDGYLVAAQRHASKELMLPESPARRADLVTAAETLTNRLVLARRAVCAFLQVVDSETPARQLEGPAAALPPEGRRVGAATGGPGIPFGLPQPPPLTFAEGGRRLIGQVLRKQRPNGTDTA